LGERAEAVRRYRLYLDRVPDAGNRGAVESKIQKLEAELKAEAEARARPPAPTPPPETTPPATGPAETAPGPEGGMPLDGDRTAGATGDPELDRVAAIDIAQVRAERQAALGLPAGSAAGGPAAGGGPSPAEPPEPPDKDEPSKPIYKRRWFWVVAGVSAIILIDIATSGSEETDVPARGLLLPPPGSDDLGSPAVAAVSLRFLLPRRPKPHTLAGRDALGRGGGGAGPGGGPAGRIAQHPRALLGAGERGGRRRT